MKEQKTRQSISDSEEMRLDIALPKAIGQGGNKYQSLMTRGVPALIFFAVLLVYANVLTKGFSFVFWDDDTTIFNNPHIRKLDEESIAWMFTDVMYVRRYIPLSWLTWSINYWIGGLDPWGFHAVNVLMHACNAVLLFWLLKLLCERGFQKQRPEDAVLVAGAAMGALFWALHPLRVEGVAWVTGRIYPQCALFFLVSMLCYVKAVMSSKGAIYKTPLYWLSVLSFAASLCTHQLAITLVGVLIVLDAYPLNRFEGESRWSNELALRIYLEKIPFLMVSVAILGLTYYARIHASGIWEPPPTWESFPLGARIMQVLYVEAYYFWRPWWISGYSPVYTTLVTNNFFSAPFILGAILISAVTAGAIFYRKRYPVFLALLFCHFVLLLPVAGWFEHPHYPSDRYSYIQGMLWSVLLCVSGVWIWLHLEAQSPKRLMQIMIMAVLLVLGARTLAQQMIWKDSEQLFKHIIMTLGEDPYRADIYWRLGEYYARQERWIESLQNFDEAIRLRPGAKILYLIKAEMLKMLSDELFKKGEGREQLTVIRREEVEAREMYYRLGGTD